MKPQDAVPPKGWETMSSEEQEKRLREGITYGFVSQFIYAPAPQLPEYYVDSQKKRKTGYYMINFRNMNKINCKTINTPEDSPLDSKILELTIDTRKELREKMKSFFGAVAEEDKVQSD